MATTTIKIVSFVLLVLCIGMAIEQSQAYWWGYGYGSAYGPAYGYAYPYGWYGKRQAGFGPSAAAGGADANVGTLAKPKA
uniref:Uncharacterized protein n=1 Tax=Globodera rostochiensis TaxID=31243 RepID=A0A914I2E9_GLORO